MAAGETLCEPSMGWGVEKLSKADCHHFLLPEKNPFSQPGSLNSPVSGSELNRPFPAVDSSAPAADCLLFYPVLPVCLCVQQLCKVAIKELN